MGNVEEIAGRNGIPIGDKGFSGSEIVDLFGNKGMNVNRESIYQVRSGRNTGNRLGARLEMHEILRSNKSARKDDFYYMVTQAGLESRVINQKGCYSNIKFSEGISCEMEISEQEVNRSLRAMRAELVLSEISGEEPLILDVFCETAQDYLAAYRHGYTSSSSIRDIDQVWDRKTIGEFYRACTVMISPAHSMRTWMPYEIDVLLEFYKRRLELGSHLSSLDRFTLDKNIGRTPLEQLIEGIRCETGILYDQGAHFTHTNVLLYGQPTKPEVS